jgi:hypothetical protein
LIEGLVEIEVVDSVDESMFEKVCEQFVSQAWVVASVKDLPKFFEQPRPVETRQGQKLRLEITSLKSVFQGQAV